MAKFGVTIAVFGGILAFVGIILLIGALLSMIKVRSFSKGSRSVTGRVGNKYVHHGNNRRYYSMDIEYTVDGRTYKRSVPADQSEYNTLKAGDPFEIKYRSDKPKKIIRVDSLREQNVEKMRKLLVASVVMTLVGIALILIRMIAVLM